MTHADQIRFALAYLRHSEWFSVTWGNGVCPVCEQSRPIGHAPTCDLRRAIAVLESKQRIQPRPPVRPDLTTVAAA